MKTIDSSKLKSPHPFKYRLTPKGQVKAVIFGMKNKQRKDVSTNIEDADYEHLKKNSAGFNHLLKERLIVVVETVADEKPAKKSKLEKEIDKLEIKKKDKGLDKKEEATLVTLKAKAAGK